MARQPSDQFAASVLWERINRDYIGDPEKVNLDDFRRDSISDRISMWNVQSNAIRYFKTMLYNEALLFAEDELRLIDRIRNRTIGNPITVRVRGRDICIDYLRSLRELLFIGKSTNLATIDSVLEIGAGFGRTCHTLLSAAPNIRRYTIVDLPNCLSMSRRYLKMVLGSQEFEKIDFITNTGLASRPSLIHDLTINIDSMAEIDAEVVQNYLAFIARNATWFYCNNPVGKYSLKSIGASNVDPEAVSIALQMGLLRATLDIFDDADVARQVPAFLSAYSPGPNWEVVRHENARPWSYYHQAMYRRGAQVNG